MAAKKKAKNMGNTVKNKNGKAGNGGNKGKDKVKPARPKALVKAKNNLKEARQEAKTIQSQIDKWTKEKDAIKEGEPGWKTAQAKLDKMIAGAKGKLFNTQKTITSASKGLANQQRSYAKTLQQSGFRGAAQNIRENANRIATRVNNQETRQTVSRLNRENRQSINETTGTLYSGIRGLTDAVRAGLPAAQQQGQDLVNANLGETETALNGGQGTAGLLDLMRQAQTQTQDISAQGQRQQLQDLRGNSQLTRRALDTLAPEAGRAIDMFGRASERANRLAKPTNIMSRQALNQQANLARGAMQRAQNYVDPTQSKVLRAGQEMFNAAGQSEQIADKATKQALNYVDPTKRLAQNAISGFQGLAGLQQKTAEQAYANQGILTPEQRRNADQAARESFASRGMLGSTGSVASEILNREASLANRRGEAAQLGQLAQQGQQGLVALSSGYESDALARRTGLQQNASELQARAGGQYGQAGSFVSGAESDRLQRRQALQSGAMGLSQAALDAQQAVRGEARQARSDLYDAGQFYTNYGLPLLTNQTAAQQTGLGLLSAGMGMSGQASGLLEAGSNIGMSRWTTEQEAAAARRAANASEDSGLFSGIGSLFGGAFAAFSDIRLKDNLRHIGDIGGYPAFEWDWNDLAPDKLQPNFGFIAQMIQQDLPEYVHAKGEYLAIDYDGLLRHLGSSVDELTNLVKAYKGKEQ